MRNACNILIRKGEGKRQFERGRIGWYDVKIYLKVLV